MVRKIRDTKNNFVEMFDDQTGFYARTGVIEHGNETGADPFMRFMPGLIDIGIMGNCVHGSSGLCDKSGIQCYQDGLHSSKPNMTVADYTNIMQECKGKVWQVALGGRGDPDMHDNFEEILRISRDNNIVPNFTTSGLGMTTDKAKICKKYCGAVAVSAYSRIVTLMLETPDTGVETKDYYYMPRSLEENETTLRLEETNFKVVRDHDSYARKQGYRYSWLYTESANYTMDAVRYLLAAKMKTNIHFVIGNNTIDEAVLRLKYSLFPAGINAVIFLLHKPIGMGKVSNVLDYQDDRVQKFYSLCDGDKSYKFKIGFDSCNVPALLNLTNNIDRSSIDTCEAARFSMYISSEMVAMPCSFDNQDLQWGVQLDYANNHGVEYSWNSSEFNIFRQRFIQSCPNCRDRLSCLGGCPITNCVALCNRPERFNG